jgi:hypothetical protein
MKRRPDLPEVRIKPPVPSPRFRAWVLQVGVTRLSRSLRKHPTTIYAWIDKERFRRPEYGAVHLIIALSHKEKPTDGKPLTYEDILGRLEAA